MRPYRRGGELFSENSYWTEDGEGSCLSLSDIQPCTPEVDVRSLDGGTLTVSVKNPGKGLALMTRLRLVDKNGDFSVLTTGWNIKETRIDR